MRKQMYSMVKRGGEAVLSVIFWNRCKFQRKIQKRQELPKKTTEKKKKTTRAQLQTNLNCIKRIQCQIYRCPSTCARKQRHHRHLRRHGLFFRSQHGQRHLGSLRCSGTNILISLTCTTWSSAWSTQGVFKFFLANQNPFLNIFIPETEENRLQPIIFEMTTYDWPIRASIFLYRAHPLGSTKLSRWKTRVELVHWRQGFLFKPAAEEVGMH